MTIYSHDYPARLVEAEARLIAAYQQIHALRRGIREVVKAHPEAPAALLTDLSALVHVAADEALDATQTPTLEEHDG